jgi:hypothetical protein
MTSINRLGPDDAELWANHYQELDRQRAFAEAPGSAPSGLGTAVGPFALYEDEDNMAHIIDGNTRVMLSDSYAYDGTAKQTDTRMKWICAALNAAWQAEQNISSEPMPAASQSTYQKP